MEQVSGGEAVAQTLAALGVEHVFGIVSVHNLPVYDAVVQHPDLEMVAVRHEQGAVHAADGYARATGRLGVALTSTGPGAANAMGGLFEAGYASAPVLMVTGQGETAFYGKGKGAIHEAERQLDMLRSVCRRAETVRFREEIPEVLRFVATDVLTGRPQPGAIEIPVDLQYGKGSPAPTDPLETRRVEPDPGLLDQAAEALAQARRPILWAGGGVVSADAAEALRQLAERLGAPVITSIEGRGAIPEDHPLSLGPSSDMTVVQRLILSADLVFAVGTRFQMATRMHQLMRIPGRLVHLDADPGVIGRNHPPNPGIVGDARLGLEGLLERVSGGAVEPDFPDRARAARAEAEEEARESMGADHERIVKAIRSELPRDANLVKDATIAAYVWANRTLPVLEPRTSMRPTSMAIGPGLGLAIGAAVGSGRKTVLVQGDGGLMLSVGELATAVEQRLPLIVCVFNDKGYGILRFVQDMMFDGRRAGVDLNTPDFAALAHSVGMAAESVHGVEEFEDAFARAAAADEPWLLDIDLASLAPMEIRPQQPPEE